MSEQVKTEMSCGAPWFPLRKWWLPSRLPSRDLGLPPFLEPGDPRWMDAERLERSLALYSWPGYVPAPLFVPYVSESMPEPGQKISKWRVSLDVAHFSTSEISIIIRDGFLEVGGKHEERPDEYGSIARCFTRKYRLPAEVDASKLVSRVSVDGILTLEAPVPEAAFPAAIIIPIKVETEDAEEQEVHEDQEVHDEQVQPGGAGVELGQEDVETREKPAGEADPSVPADEEKTESLQKSEQQETLESQEIMDAADQLEHREPAVDVEIQVKAEGAEELTQPEGQELAESPPCDVQSQELEAAAVMQHAE